MMGWEVQVQRGHCPFYSFPETRGWAEGKIKYHLRVGDIQEQPPHKEKPTNNFPWPHLP